jgi:hypothetical protein
MRIRGGIILIVKRISAKITLEQHQWLKNEAERRGTSMAAVARECLYEFVRETEKLRKKIGIVVLTTLFVDDYAACVVTPE